MTTHNPWTYVGRHRADRPAITHSPSLKFTPAHCAGDTCLHNHRHETRPSLGLWKWSA